MQTDTIDKTETLIRDKFDTALTYSEFRSWVDKLAASGSTSGSEKNESLVNYTALNSRRMKRWDKTFRMPEYLVEQIRKLDRQIDWLVLTESWCGDAAPSLPVMNKMAELNPNIQLRIVSRDENLDLMEQFRTNGNLSIPKLIAIDQTSGDILGDWGPRPFTASKMVKTYKEEHGKLTAEFREDLQRWYNQDKGQEILNELAELLALE